MIATAARCGLLFLTTFFFTHAALAQQAGWPRQFHDLRGTHTLTQPPQRIVSTSVTLTGSLLAIDAPVVASGSTIASNRIADEQGFFRQWGEVARARGVARIPPGEPNVETVAMQKPDLILVSATGGDSALALYDRLAALAPVVVVNYDDKSWQQLLTLLGDITGHEKQAAQRIARFDRAMEQMKQRIKLPAQPVNALVWDIHSQSANLWTPESAQGQFLLQAGMTLAPLPENVRPRATQGRRQDIVPLMGENLVNGLSGKTLLLFAATDSSAQSLMASPLLSHQPAVAAKQVYPLGAETFRLDYYSAMGLVQQLNELFGAAR
ncbi:Ferrienterobactin-binding periplasmic protein [Mixta theicola]|nr:Ferrienterobactin-binding periplasmic protein [Mixta theicola]